MASHDFESFIRRQLSELRDRLVAEYRRVDRACPASSSWTQPITGIENSWSPRISELEDADEVSIVTTLAVNGATKAFAPAPPPAPHPEPAHSPNAAGLPELFDTEVNYSEFPERLSNKEEDKSISKPVTKSPIHPVRDSYEKADCEQHSASEVSSDSEEFVNHEENLTQRLSQLDMRLSQPVLQVPKMQQTGTGGQLAISNISNGKGRSVRMSAMVSTETIEAKCGSKTNGDGRLWGLEELAEGDCGDDDSDEPRRKGGYEGRKSQRRSAAFAETPSKASRHQSFVRRQESEKEGSAWVGTPRGSGSHIFTVLPVWTTSGVAAMRKRAFSMRTKSLFLEVDLEKTKEDCTSHVPPSWWMLHPSSTKHLMWDMFGLALLAYDCVLIPLEVYEIADTGFILGMAWTIRMYWTASIFKSFITGYLKNDGAVEMRFALVARRYCLTWLPMDLVVVLVDWAEVVVAGFASGGFQRFGSGLRGLRMVRTVRLIRLIKAPEITSFINEQIRSEQILLVATIAKVIIIMLGVAHVLACAWFGIGRWSASGQISWLRESGVDKLDKGQQYVSSFHWSLSQFAGELTQYPQNSSERIFTVCVLFFAIMVSAWFVSSITTSMTQLQIITSQQSTQTAVLRRYLVDQNISRPLALRVQRNAQHALREQKKNASENSVELLKFISNPLLVELHFEIHGHVLFHHPFFLHYNMVNPGGMRKVCHMAVSVLSLHPGDVLFRDLEVPTHRRMFFVINGGLVYKHGQNSTTYVEKGDWMCEAILWTTWTHCGTVKAYTETQLLVLEAEKFQDTISTFPSDHPAQYAEEFIKRLNQAGRFLTDIALDQWELQDMIHEAFPKEESSSEDEDDENEGEDEVVRQSTTNTDTMMPAPTKRSSITSTKSGGRTSRKNSRLSRTSQMLTRGFSTLLGTSPEKIVPQRSNSKVSNRDASVSEKVNQQRDSDKARKMSSKKKSTSSGGLIKGKSSSLFKSMRHTKQSIFSRMSHASKAASTRGSMEGGPPMRNNSEPVSTWQNITAMFRKNEMHDAPPPPPVQIEVNGNFDGKKAEDPLVSNAWSSLGHMDKRDSETSIDSLQEMQVVPMGRPGSGLSFNEQRHEIHS
mmetsp:Transcript_8043/g.15026  ORF Transcript_8043/g.15026 Transcript_8043/m.15026 type:complete len:1104 (+) Transcript_8043:76-3387(+)